MQVLALTMTAESAEADKAEQAKLLKLAKSGDASAFERILMLHERRVFLTALRLLGRVEDAQDAAQETFLRLHKHLRRFDEEREFAPWLYRMTVNVCRDIARKRERDAGLRFGTSAAWTDPAAEIGREDEKRMMSRALETLPEKERAAIVLRDIEGLPTRDVARALGSSEATVRSQVSSARLKLKRFVDRARGGKL